MSDLILKKGKEKSLLRRHPWVYDTAVERVVGKPIAGDTVRVLSRDGRFLTRTKSLMTRGLSARSGKPFSFANRSGAARTPFV